MISLRIGSLNQYQLLFARHIGIPIDDDGFDLRSEKSDHLFVKAENKCVRIGYSKTCELYRGLALLKEDVKVGDVIEQKSRLDSLSAFFDCSRNAVLNLPTIKSLIMDIAALGYDSLFLYTEDTIEIKGEPYFGHWRGRYTAEEIKEADAFAKEFGIELIPAVQTLAHMNTIFHWKRFESIHDIADILLCDEKETYEFLEKMIASIRSMYTSDKINIGMDEAHLLGLGKYLVNNGFHSKMDIFLRHINKVMEILEKYNFKPIMWSDMFFKIASGRCTYEQLDAVEFRPEILERIPKTMSLAYWNYSPRPKEYYDAMFKAHLMMGREVIFAGGFRKWAGFCPSTQYSFNASRNALESAFQHEIRKVIITGWGDNGAEGAAYLMLPGLVLFAEKCYLDDMSDEAIDHRLKVLYEYSLEDFLMLESPNRAPDKYRNSMEKLDANPSKNLLWNDPLLGQYDKHITPGSNEFYIKLAEKLKELKERHYRFNYLFETVYCLCEFLSDKAELGVHIRQAYKSGNKSELKKIHDKLPTMIEKLEIFHKVFRKNWLKENKIFGFEVQDIRFGALRARIAYTYEILSDYLDGKVSSIPELEEECLYFDCREENDKAPLHFTCNSWARIATVGVL